MDNIFTIASNIKTPISLAGLALAVIFSIFKIIVSKKDNTQVNNHTIESIINKLFILVLIVIALGGISWIIPLFNTSKVVSLSFNIEDIDDGSPLDSVNFTILNVPVTSSCYSDNKGLITISFNNYNNVDSLLLGFISTKYGISNYRKKEAVNNFPKEFSFDARKSIIFSTKIVPSDSIKTLNVLRNENKISSTGDLGSPTKNLKNNNNSNFAARIKSFLYKVPFNSSINDVFKYEFGSGFQNLDYESLPVATECTGDSIRYYWRYLDQSPIKTEVYSYLSARGLQDKVTKDSYVVYAFKDKKLVRVSLRIFYSSNDFKDLFIQSLIEGTSLSPVVYNKASFDGFFYISGSSFTDYSNTFEILMCNEVGYNCCVHDWWHN
jgi:hypothetical protein